MSRWNRRWLLPGTVDALCGLFRKCWCTGLLSECSCRELARSWVKMVRMGFVRSLQSQQGRPVFQPQLPKKRLPITSTPDFFFLVQLLASATSPTTSFSFFHRPGEKHRTTTSSAQNLRFERIASRFGSRRSSPRPLLLGCGSP